MQLLGNQFASMASSPVAAKPAAISFISDKPAAAAAYTKNAQAS
jgi:hypothetical protein